MDGIKDYMEEQLHRLEREIKRSTKQLNILPRGTLAVRNRNSKKYLYRIFRDRNGRIKEKVMKEKDRSTVERIQNRVVMERHIKMMEQAVKDIRVFLKKYQSCDLTDARRIVNEVYREPLDYQGFHINTISDATTNDNPLKRNGYENKFHSDELIHRNSIGEQFRSKGEVQVSELLLNRKVKYIYETKLYLPDGIVYPDFTITTTGDERPKYIEYCGMMENEDYLKRAIHKLRSYMRGGLKPDRDVLFFFEDGDNGTDVQIMKKRLDTFLAL